MGPSYKNGEVSHVSELRLRELLLKTGYTEFAVACLGLTGVADLEISRTFPQSPEHRISVAVYTPNKYGLGIKMYDGVAVAYRIANLVPDYPRI